MTIQKIKALTKRFPKTNRLSEFLEFYQKEELGKHSTPDNFLTDLKNENLFKDFMDKLHRHFKHQNPKYSILNQYNTQNEDSLDFASEFFKKKTRAFFTKHEGLHGLAKLSGSAGIQTTEIYSGYYSSLGQFGNEGQLRLTCGIQIKDSIGIIVFQQTYYIGKAEDFEGEYLAVMFLMIVGLALGIRQIKINGDSKAVIHPLQNYRSEDCKYKTKVLLHQECILLKSNFEIVTFRLIPKFLNKEVRDFIEEKVGVGLAEG